MLIFIILIAVIGLICLNVPIAISLALAGVLGLLITEGPSSLVTVALDMYDGSTKFSLIAIPMFVLAGAIMNAGGVTRRCITRSIPNVALALPGLFQSRSSRRQSTRASVKIPGVRLLRSAN